MAPATFADWPTSATTRRCLTENRFSVPGEDPGMKKPIPFDTAQVEVEALIDAAEKVADTAEGGMSITRERLPFEVPRAEMLGSGRF